ncbi:MAG: HAMP domain-containing histidine kinase [Rhodospirillaceae bacterium]|jgi:signal transduction histidine kinase|nr:HAMP domain-containing histidine kinase [Rhodospirillaceae bacterium]MBT5459322.1 HAMP domain-containing histidine kinase [Rhodospirillaceae bacterium]
MAPKTAIGRRKWFGLSARLLLLTIFFVMLSEVFIYAPSIGRFRVSYLQERVAAAHLASLALEVPPDNMVSAQLRQELLDHAGAHGIVIKRPASKSLVLSTDMPPKIHATYDLAKGTFFGLIGDAFMTLAEDGSRVLRIIGRSPQNPNVEIEVVVSEEPLRMAMIDYSARILALSILISLMTAVAVYFSLQWLFVRPVQSLTASMVSFREDPEDGRRLVVPGTRSDELGVAQRELADMQRGLRDALMQKTRLAALGTAVTKINHDLRNILATAQLVSDHLDSTDDPNVKRIAPTLMGAIDRAVTLCSKTLRFAQEDSSALEMMWFPLRPLVEEVAVSAGGEPESLQRFDNSVEQDIRLHADRDQIFRVLNNLVRNAYEAGAHHVLVTAQADHNQTVIEIVDDGPGLPDRIRANLFQPFTGSTRVGGSGLGLSIARDLMRGHGGDVELKRTGDDGTVFRLVLPLEVSVRDRAAAAVSG